MKKITLILAIALLPFAATSQSIFDKFEDMDDVGSVIVNKGMIDLLTSIGSLDNDREAREFVEMAKGINGIKVFMTENKTVAADMSATVHKYLRSSDMEELMRVKDKGVNVKFYVKNGKKRDHVTELLMFVSGLKEMEVDVNNRKFETVLVTMTGDIDLNQIGTLTKNMDLPDELNSARKRNR
ncbi:DUF4252 domain-containing protein [Maribacter polysaccharolyticus]|uniref:DUF4252 domain-containing protein n=1 Tax=Maribacter polysaccharolyticus TaxID=3020831 RepID=UPI00237F7C0D|nr:DUF4252 domain-containing protein [Maribacter polysaccharolyticus]MDE3740724.1 DUF4252 domain-containing protein [Maribacter polysaccharolyticus]